jgi:hypothetical protein
MKTNKFILFCLFCFTTISIYGQQALRKPSFTVLPSDSWCYENKFTETDGNGETYNDYKRAFTENPNMELLVSRLSSFFQDRFNGKFLLRNFVGAKKTQQARNARAGLTNSSGRTSKSNEDTDYINNQVDSDVKLEISYWFVKEGPKNNLKFKLDAIDNYSQEPVASISKLGGISTYDNDFARLIEEELNNQMDTFFARLETYFDEVYKNGLKVSYDFEMMDNADKNFESEYDGEELTNKIEDWFVKNAVRGSYRLESSSDEKLVFSEVRVPVQDENGRSMTADLFAVKIKKYFEAAPYNFKVNIQRSGLGYSRIKFSKK